MTPYLVQWSQTICVTHVGVTTFLQQLGHCRRERVRKEKRELTLVFKLNNTRDIFIMTP